MNNEKAKTKKNALGRILFVSSTLPRWQGDTVPHFVLHLAQDLRDLGWEIDILAPHADKAAYSETINDITIKRFPYFWPSRHQTLCYQSGALINIRENKANIVKIPFFIVAEYLAIVRRLYRKKYDLIHCHWVIPQGLTGILASLPFKVPQVTTIHGGDIYSLNSDFFNHFKKFALQHSKAITVNSSSTQQACTNIYPNHPQCHKIPMGISLPDIDNIKTEKIKNQFLNNADSPLLIFAGRLIEEKGVEDLIHAIKILKQDLPEIKLLILGSGQKQKYYQDLTASLSLTENISFLGWVSPEEVPSYLAAGDIFIAPSIHAKNGWKEAQGLVFLEAMAVKTAVIATSIGGISDIVQHEKTGLLVDEKSPVQIADAINRLIKNTDLGFKLGQQGYDLVSKQYTRKNSAKCFSELFQKITKTS